ncbi:MAG: phospho-sugar mutase [Myxococcales bacterium]|nr:phospho-sugar mutase [Myxococcales bacterium]MCB9577735.1 phospho-sugar mutase [Polyangiaceae bacterium]
MADKSPVERAREWMDQDPDPETRADLLALIDAGNETELAERMHAPLEFGTAGLRGVVGAGINRMNRAVVIRATRGLADRLLKEPDARTLPVVVGYDGRTHSRQFAEDAIAVLVEAGIPVRWFDGPTSTPMVAYAARELSAQSAIVITASHNPPEYNGYKVYAPNAAQIVPPWDTEIAEAIDAVGPAKDVPLAQDALSRAETIPDSLFDRYLAEVGAVRPKIATDPSLTIVYTPMHGVGWRFAKQAFSYAGYEHVHVVPEQAEPDGRFPTVRFPNPEEKGAMDLALSLADKQKAELILANDPDADRLAACVPTAAGRWVQLTGNQIGLLLADFMLAHALKAPQPLVVSSIVSSPMLGSIAEAHGARFEQTLTGFKWIANCAMDLERDAGVRFAFGYEEALGYSVGRIVRDKDGISAAVLLADLAAHLKTENKTLLDQLDALYRRHGLWVSLQKSITRPGSEGLAEIAKAVEHVAANRPELLAGQAVTAMTDYRSGGDERPRWLPDTNMVGLALGPKGRVLVRPSGTEPKLKIYVDLAVEVSASASVRDKEAEALDTARAIADAVAEHAGLGAE